MTTNDGTPTTANQNPWKAPIAARRRACDDRPVPRPARGLTITSARIAEQRIDTEPTERSISLSRSTSTMPTASVPVDADLEDEVREVARREERRLLSLEVRPDHRADRRAPAACRARPAGAARRDEVFAAALPEPCSLAPSSSRRRESGHQAACSCAPVIAATTSSGGVPRRRTSRPGGRAAARRSGRRREKTLVQVVRDHDDAEAAARAAAGSARAPAPSARRRARRSARRGSRAWRSTSPRGRSRPTGAVRPRAWRPVRARRDRRRRASPSSTSSARFSISSSWSGPSRPDRARSRPRNMLATTSRLSQSARSW